MAQMKIVIRCYHCSAETETEVSVPEKVVAVVSTKRKPFYCGTCNRLNMVDLPDTWDVSNPVLGDGVLGYSNGLPVVQGNQA